MYTSWRQWWSCVGAHTLGVYTHTVPRYAYAICLSKLCYLTYRVQLLRKVKKKIHQKMSEYKNISLLLVHRRFDEMNILGVVWLDRRDPCTTRLCSEIEFPNHSSYGNRAHV